MNYKLVLRIISRVLLLEAGCMFLPLVVAVIYGEDTRPFGLTILLLGAIATPGAMIRCKSQFFSREGFVTVGAIWLMIGLFGAIPFHLSGYFGGFANSLFESVSGFTTTGASILTEVESLPKGILFWRSMIQWLGGMGILVLTIALVPAVSVHGAQSLYLMRAEVPGPVSSKLVPKLSQSSKILYAIYVGLTLLEILCLLLAGMSPYDSIVIGISTAGTGGFAVTNLSIGSYSSAAIEIIITVFMLLFSINFALYFLILSGRLRQALRSDELRLFLSLVTGSALIIALNTNFMYASPGESLRHAFFQVASIISTTGFSTVDFNQWPEFSKSILILLMFCGGCAGSTSGGLKCSRVLLLFRSLLREIRQIIHPRSVNVVKLDGKIVDESTLHSAIVYFATFMIISLGFSLIMALDNFSFESSFTATVSCLTNVGPGLDAVGPLGNYSGFSPLSKVVLSLCMIIGRLEIFPILVLFTRSAWCKS